MRVCALIMCGWENDMYINRSTPGSNVNVNYTVS